jgi:hypothetical protein
MTDLYSGRRTPSAAAIVVLSLGLLLVVYFGLFGVIIIDELYFNSAVFSREGLRQFKDAVKIIYWPLLAPFGA